MENMNFCQSCGMPMNVEDEAYGTNVDGTKSTDYCSYCYDNGEFLGDMTMEEMIAVCIPPMVENNPNMTEASAKEMMEKFFPSLKRWEKQ